MWVGVAVAAISGVTANVQRNKANTATKWAEIDANKDAIQARKSEVFAETEGEGVGSLGQISLDIDDDLDDDETANLRI